MNLLDMVAGEGYVVEAEHSLGHGVVCRVDVNSEACTHQKMSQCQADK